MSRDIVANPEDGSEVPVKDDSLNGSTEVKSDDTGDFLEKNLPHHPFH